MTDVYFWISARGFSNEIDFILVTNENEYEQLENYCERLNNNDPDFEYGIITVTECNKWKKQIRKSCTQYYLDTLSFSQFEPHINPHLYY